MSNLSEEFKIQELENSVLMHRYLYYVLAQPVLPDSVYDTIEREAREKCPPSSPVHKLGSSLPSDYPEYIKELAKKYLI